MKPQYYSLYCSPYITFIVEITSEIDNKTKRLSNIKPTTTIYIYYYRLEPNFKYEKKVVVSCLI